MINNRQQNGRRRGRGGQGNGGGGGQRNGNPGRPDSGNRIDSRARGNANQLYEKYKNLARDSQMSGDRVNTEYYLQFADHYFRVLSESRRGFEDQQPRRQSSDPFDDFDGDEDYGDEGEAIRAGEQAGEDGRGNRRDQGEPRDGRDRDAREMRDARDRDGRDTREPRESRDRDGRDREVRDRDGRDRDGRDAQRGNPDREPRRNGPPATARGDERPARATAPAGLPPIAPVANDVDESPAEAAALEPRRTRRPRRDREVASAENDAPAAIEADRLPPSLSVASDTGGDEAAEEPKPRRRRLRTVNAGETSQAG